MIEARRAENEDLGDIYGREESHEERIRVQQATHDALRLERLHAAEEAAGRSSSAWNEQTGEWGGIQEANYEMEGGAESEGSGSDEDGSDMDLESEDEKSRPQRDEAYGDDEEADMDIESDSDDDD